MYLKTDQASTSFPLLLLGAREILRLSGTSPAPTATRVGSPFPPQYLRSPFSASHTYLYGAACCALRRAYLCNTCAHKTAVRYVSATYLCLCHIVLATTFLALLEGPLARLAFFLTMFGSDGHEWCAHEQERPPRTRRFILHGHPRETRRRRTHVWAPSKGSRVRVITTRHSQDKRQESTKEKRRPCTP